LGGRKIKKLSHRASRNKYNNTCTFLMVLCNSQREEEFILTKICKTLNRVIPQNYKIEFEQIFCFLCLFYWIVVEKTSMQNCVKEIFFVSVEIASELFLKTVFTSGQFVQK